MKKKISGRFILIVGLATLATILIIWRLFIYSPTAEPVILVLPTPSPSSLPTLPAEQERGDSPLELGRALEEKFPLYRDLPYETSRFFIDYLGPLYLEVEIKSKPVEIIKQEVVDWLWSKEINPSTHEIKYLIPEL